MGPIPTPSPPASAPTLARRMVAALILAVLCVVALAVTGALGAGPTDTKHVMVLRVRFADYASTTRYSKADVNGFFGKLDTLWRDTSYDNIAIDAQVTDLIALPKNRDKYVTDESTGDLSKKQQYWDVLKDAIAAAPKTGLDWSDLDAIMVVMGETSSTQFHRGQGQGGCSLKQGPASNAATKSVGCAIFSENPSETDVAVWGRWAHELGHAFQVGGPAHPSNYNSEFELMDSNYPGQTGVFEKQAGQGFPGWLPEDHYQPVVPQVAGAAPSWAPAGAAVGGALVNLRAMEHDPAGAPNLQAARVYVTKSLYYLVSVRRRILGDELNSDFTPAGIPDEGVLIERVVEGGNTAINDCPGDPTPCPRWVEVIGPGGDADALWTGATSADSSLFRDGILFRVRKIDDDNYDVRISYDMSPQPDVMVSPWRSPPLNTWESTDIWVDSPVNGYGTYRYGQIASTHGDTVPRGNGDDPAVGQKNRLYARVRNLGTTPASDVVVSFDRTDPEGRGINGSNGFTALGSVTKAQFPALASIPAGGTVDVYVDYTPAFTPTPQQIAEGTFAFHTCVRVRIGQVSGETVLGNQDGDGEQENIDYFQAVQPSQPGAPKYSSSLTLRNDDPVNPKFFSLSYESGLPASWGLDVNGGVQGVLLKGGESVEVPITITPPGTGPAPALGRTYAVDIQASFDQELVNPKLPVERQRHLESKVMGGVRVEARVMAPTALSCVARRVVNAAGAESIRVSGRLTGVGRTRQRVFIEGVIDRLNGALPASGRLVTTDLNGRFQGTLRLPREGRPNAAVCLFAGTRTLASAGAGPVPIR